MSRPRIVIVGAGFGGMEAARALAKVDAEVLVIDQRNHHTFQPLLYQVASAALSPAEIAWPIRHMLRSQANAQVLLAKVHGVDLAAKLVKTSFGDQAYDVLVLAVGATHAYFGRDDWAPFAPGLKSLEDATAIRARVLSSFEHAEVSSDEAARKRLLTFAIVGAGPTGVEMAGALAEIARDALARDFRRIDPKAARIVLIEAGPRILPALPEPLSAYARRVLEKIGVEILTDTLVTGIDAQGLEIGASRIEAATMIWGAGVAASPLVQALPGEHDRQGRLKVAPDLSVPGHPEVFVVGDAASAAWIEGKTAPGIAPAAKQMGAFAAKRIIAQMAGGAAQPAAFAYKHQGDLATIGRNAAVVQIGKVALTGFPAWLFWGAIHVYFLIGLKRRFTVAVDWMWSYLTRQRGARLITGEWQGDKPAH